MILILPILLMNPNAIRTGDDYLRCHVHKQSMLHDTRALIKHSRQFVRIFDPDLCSSIEPAAHQVIAVFCHNWPSIIFQP